jgi:hypothetical protein
MHTGTLISDLMATVERVGQGAQQQETADQQELHSILAMQIPVMESDQIFIGAA